MTTKVINDMAAGKLREFNPYILSGHAQKKLGLFEKSDDVI